jgi:hypothetical protein
VASARLFGRGRQCQCVVFGEEGVRQFFSREAFSNFRPASHPQLYNKTHDALVDQWKIERQERERKENGGG